MKRYRQFAILLAVSIAVACSAIDIPENKVPLDELLAHPNLYLGRVVTVYGQVGMQFEDTNLYALPSSATHRCVTLVVTGAKYRKYKSFNGKSAYVRGRLLAPACPKPANANTEIICSWSCNDEYGIMVDTISH